MQFAPLGLAQAVVTPGFNLPNRIVIHCRGPKYHFDLDPALNLARCLENVLILAEQEGVRRIAIPAISMGVYGYPAIEGVPILVNTATQLSKKLVKLQEIRFALTSDLLFEQFLELIAE